ncbi:MAG TPA: radical SAM protein [Methylovirgula sp.]|nr:radical SAM protein [Methylovirgula sp.]
MRSPPYYIFIETIRRCNLKCGHCFYWHDTDADRANYLPLSRKIEVLGEFQALNPRGTMVTCGGESMLDLKTYFGMTHACRRLGLTAASVVNGTRIQTPEMADRMIAEGPHEISISLNSHRRELHDRTRGVQGAFDKAVNALRLLLEARARVPGCTSRIYVMGLVFDENYRELEQFYEFVLNDIGADKLKLNFLQPAFAQDDATDAFLRDHHNVDPDELFDIIQRCDRRFGLGLNPLWLRQVRMYWRSLNAAKDLDRGWGSKGRTSEHICNTYERNIMVDVYGNARLCFSTEFGSMKLEKPGDLRRFWESAGAIRRSMSQCNRFCGISHSVRRESSTREPTRKLPSKSAAVRAVDFLIDHWPLGQVPAQPSD